MKFLPSEIVCFLLLLCFSHSLTLSLPKIFGTGMVLQKAPERAQVLLTIPEQLKSPVFMSRIGQTWFGGNTCSH